MTLIKSISGIRGTIGGKVGEGLTPFDTLKFALSFGEWIKNRSKKQNPTIVLGRDARISGEMISNLVISSLQSIGIDVINLNLSTTPTVEIAVPIEKADGGIILTASHNPKQWNALKLLNEKGEFISAKDGEEVLFIAENENYIFSEIDHIGKVTNNDTYLQKHIELITNLPLVNNDLIRRKKFKIVVDAVNSTGGIFVPALLHALGVNDVIEIYCEPNGNFPHNPEPLPENLTEIANLVVKHNADLGIVVDPDVDRLALVCEDGSMFGEEYTLVAVADYILKNKTGNTVSNLSSTVSLKEITENYPNSNYFASAVGEVNVVEKMKEVNAVIGGEGNGGIIYPEFHYGRDALVGIALFLSHLAMSGLTCKELRDKYPNYTISKNKIELEPSMDVDKILSDIQNEYKNEEIDTQDGVKIYFGKEWVHLRKSNTEPIIRIYSESDTEEKANLLAEKIIAKIQQLV